MKLITKEIERQLLKNGANPDQDHKPVLKLFDPSGSATWLINEMDPNDPDMLFGLCDMGAGYPELGYVSLSQLQQIRGRFGLGIERDRHFSPKAPMSVYVSKARENGQIVENI
jgi:hypothetical protein